MVGCEEGIEVNVYATKYKSLINKNDHYVLKVDSLMVSKSGSTIIGQKNLHLLIYQVLRVIVALNSYFGCNCR